MLAPARVVFLLIGLFSSDFGVHDDLDGLPFGSLALEIDGDGFPGCLFGVGLVGELFRVLDVVGRVVFVVFFVEEEDGLGSGVVDACVIGCLGD